MEDFFPTAITQVNFVYVKHFGPYCYSRRDIQVFPFLLPHTSTRRIVVVVLHFSKVVVSAGRTNKARNPHFRPDIRDSSFHKTRSGQRVCQRDMGYVRDGGTHGYSYDFEYERATRHRKIQSSTNCPSILRYHTEHPFIW
jgi:hypothetical protein